MCWLALLHVVKSVNSSNSRQINRLTKQKMILWPGMEIVCRYFLLFIYFFFSNTLNLYKAYYLVYSKKQYLFYMAGYGLRMYPIYRIHEFIITRFDYVVIDYLMLIRMLIHCHTIISL